MERSYSDKELIDRIQSGTKQVHDEALKYLYKAYYPFIRIYVVKNSGGNEDAADIFQEAIVVLYNKIREKTFRGDSNIKTFLYSVARNLWLKELRKHPVKISGITDIEEFTNFEQIESISSETEEKENIVRKLINELGNRCKEILIDYYYTKLSMKEIMLKLGLGSEQATKNKKYRCMQRLIELCKQNELMNKD
jgi:RNA polymerase sigma factor (sigma-70 family)